MRRLLDSCWRAAAYCMHPRVLLLSLWPLLLSGALAAALGWFFWEDAVNGVRLRLEGSALLGSALDWLATVGAGGLRAVIAPLIVVALALPAMVVLSLLVVALVMAPKLVGMVAARRFPLLAARHREPAWRSWLWSAGATVVAAVALLVSMPLWLVPPLVLVLPPLIWGWLGYRVMSFDALAGHATPAERQTIMRAHRMSLLGIGVITGYLGAAPAMVWAVSATLLVFAPLLIVVSVWLYTIVFAFSALWFAHYCLSALEALRSAEPPAAAVLSPSDASAPVLPPA